MSLTPDLLAALRREIAEAPVSELPAIIGALAAAQAEATLRLHVMPPKAEGKANVVEDVLTVSETANLLKMSERFVRERQAQLGCIRVGRALRFPRSRVEAFLRSPARRA